MKQFPNTTLNKNYHKLYNEYELLIHDMRLYWEQEYGKIRYYDRFNDEFYDRKSRISSIITKELLNLKGNVLLVNDEIIEYSKSLYKMSINLDFHYMHYHVSSLPF